MISVSNIERFATHDGPGIRTTIFLKGCPLHCPWCANPETWNIKPVLMHDENKCIKCKLCQKKCPQRAITFNPTFTLNKKLCISCGKCLNDCVQDAISISGKNMSINEIISIASKDDLYYQKSNGGITLSGGEPLFQFNQTLELIKTLKQKNYHLALETTGMYSLNNLKEVEQYIDLFLFDIKHLDKDKLRSITGGDLNIILKNVDYLSKKCSNKVIIRVPVIPGFNQDMLEKIIVFSRDRNFKEVNLLPYHSLGKNKWHNLKKEYKYENLKMMDKEELNKYIIFGNKNNIIVKIGG